MSAALALSDLIVHGDGPRVADRRLEEALGFTDEYSHRRLIARHIEELKTYGEFPVTSSGNGNSKGGRPSKTYWLNETQALLVCLLARTERAAEVRRQVIAVFLAWRRGELTPPPAPALPPPPDPFALAAGRLALAEAQCAFQADRVPEPLALAVAVSPVWSNGRRPGFWADLPVRTLLTGAHRQMPIATARELCLRRFGEARTPSKTALHRYWMVLDRVRGGRA